MLNELEILRHLLPRLPSGTGVVTGAGDDCAAVTFSSGMEQLCAADQLILNVHFTADTAPGIAGAKLMNRNLSDVAAMGGIPRFALLTLAANGQSGAWLEEFAAGVAAAGKIHQTWVVGGDVSGLPAPGFVATLSILGEIEPGTAVRRSGARPGEALYVTGRIGNSFASGRHLDFTPRLAEGRFLRTRASAMLDVSDGLLLDAQRLAAASKVDLLLDLEAVPLHPDALAPAAWSDGEDYELLFTAPAGLEQVWPERLAPITCIGGVRPGGGVLRHPDGRPLNPERSGYEH